jgi:hypothetical protein
MKFGTRTLTLLSLLCVCFVVGCSPPEKITVIVPNNFHGLVKIFGKVSAGSLADTKEPIRLPASGELLFVDQNPIYRRYNWQIQFIDGRSIPFYRPDGSISNDTVAFRHVWRKKHKRGLVCCGNLSGRCRCIEKA